jgi:hypothetical protein
MLFSLCFHLHVALNIHFEFCLMHTRDAIFIWVFLIRTRDGIFTHEKMNKYWNIFWNTKYWNIGGAQVSFLCRETGRKWWKRMGPLILYVLKFGVLFSDRAILERWLFKNLIFSHKEILFFKIGGSKIFLIFFNSWIPRSVIYISFRTGGIAFHDNRGFSVSNIF